MSACRQLEPGFISIWALNSENPDEIAFVATADIPAAVKALYLTDAPFNGTHLDTSREGLLEYQVPEGGIPMNELFGMFDNNKAMWPSVNGTGTFAMSTAGDNVFLYCLDPDSNPHYLVGMTWAAGGWTDNFTATPLTTDESALPPGLTGGIGVVEVSGFANWQYVPGQEPNDQASGLREAMSDPGNWNGNDLRFNLDQYSGGNTAQDDTSTATSPLMKSTIVGTLGTLLLLSWLLDRFH